MIVAQVGEKAGCFELRAADAAGMTSTTTVLRVGHPRDLLAYVPFRLGYRPRESLVVVRA